MAWAAAAPALAAGAASLIGDAMSASSAGSINQKTMNFDADMMRQQEAFQAQQSATAVQTRVKDIEAAGLNPLLAISGGGAPAAQAMSGSAPSVSLQNPGAAYANLGQQSASAVQAGIGGYQAASNVNLQSAQGTASRADAALKYATAAKTAGVDTDVARAQVANIMQGTVTSGTQAGLNVANTNIAENLTPALMRAQTDAAQTAAGMNVQAVAESKSRQELIAGQVQNLLSATNLNDANTALTNIRSQLTGLNADQVRLMMPMVLEQARNAVRIGGQQIDIAEPLAAFARTPGGFEDPSLKQFEGMLETARSFIPFTHR